MAIIGIDLGTTYSAMAMLKGGRPEIIPNAVGGRTTPSVVGLSKKNEILVGMKPKTARLTLSDGPIEEIKREMGKDTQIKFGGQLLSPQEISSYILASLKKDAEQYLGEPVNCAIVTTPAYFQEPAWRATKEAGEKAGLVVPMVLAEPSAAALAYSFDKKDDRTFLIYDLGGGTFDVSIIASCAGHFETLAISGNNRLGGRDFDKKIIEYVIAQVKKQQGVDLQNDERAVKKLVWPVEQAKCDLSSQRSTNIIVEAIAPDLDIDVELTRDLLEQLIGELVNSTVDKVKEALEKAELTVKEIDNILLVGGSTRIPLVKKIVRDFLGKEPLCDINPDECVALGAAVYTSLLSEEVKKQFVAPQKLPDFVPVDSSGEKVKLSFVPRTAHALGIGTAGNKLSIIIPANSFYPISVTKKDFATMRDDQRELEGWVYEGENPIARQNDPVGLIHIAALPGGLREGTSVWVTFTLNDSRILEVKVELPDHPGVGATISLDASGSMSEETKRKLREEHAQGGGGTDSSILKHLIEEAEAIVKYNRSKIEPGLRSRMEQLMGVLADALETQNVKLAMEKAAELTQTMDQVRRSLV